MPSILAVSRNAEHGFSKLPQPSLRLLVGEGVEHDAHCGRTVQHLYLKRRNPHQLNLCQVHLLAAEMLAELAAKGFSLPPGALGENILTQGLDLLSLPLGTSLHLGASAILQITGLRTPCQQIDSFRSGLQQHLWGPAEAGSGKTRRAGIMSLVLAGGLIYPDDPIRVELPPPPFQPLGPV